MKKNQHLFIYMCRVLTHIVYLCTIFFSPFVSCFAQKPGTKYSEDTAAINHLLKVADKILNPDSAITLFDSALKLSTEANYPEAAVHALATKGIKYAEKEDNAQSRECFIQALPWAAKSHQKVDLAWCYNGIGDNYLNEGNYAMASEYCFKGLQELKKISQDSSQIAVNIYGDLGLINLRLNQIDKALFYFDEAENISGKKNYFYQLANTYLFKGDYYTSVHKSDSAIKYFNGIMEIGKKIGKIDLQAQAFEYLGKTFIDAGKYETAVSNLQTAISLARDRYPYLVADASYSLGDAWFHMHKYKDAETILLSVLSETKAHNYKDRYIDCYTKLVAVYKATGQYQKAMDCMDTIAVLRDSLFSTEKTKAINLMEVKYKTAEKDKELAQNQLLIARQKNKLTQKNLWIIYIVTGVFLLTLLLLFIYRNARHKERLQEERIKTLQKENTIGILKGVVQGEENERTRLARELHDGIGGMLSAAMMRFMTIRHDNDSITKIPAYNEAMNLLDEMGDEIRKTAHNLMPEVLLKQTLPEALRTYCNSVQEGSALQIDCQCYGTFDNLSQDFKLNVYRIIQELLKNITEHAHATHALVQLMIHENILAITVEDNGIGFDTGEIKDGIGLYNLQTRVRSQDGNYTLESKANKGTSVFIELPLNNITEDRA